MQIRYSKAYSGLMIGLGTLLALVNIGLLGLGGERATGLVPGLIILMIGALSFGKAYAIIEDEEFAVKNFFGMKLRKTPVSQLFVEPVGSKRRLYRTKDNGKRQRLLTAPNWVFDREDAEAFLNNIGSASVFD